MYSATFLRMMILNDLFRIIVTNEKQLPHLRTVEHCLCVVRRCMHITAHRCPLKDRHQRAVWPLITARWRSDATVLALAPKKRENDRWKFNCSLIFAHIFKKNHEKLTFGGQDSCSDVAYCVHAFSMHDQLFLSTDMV